MWPLTHQSVTIKMHVTLQPLDHDLLSSDYRNVALLPPDADHCSDTDLSFYLETTYSNSLEAATSSE